MSGFVRVRHPETGRVSRIAHNQWEGRLKKRGFTLVEGEGAETPPRATSAPQASEEDVDTAYLAELLGRDVAGALRAAGFGTLGAIKAASDEELLAVEGVGKARLEKLRAGE